ncbi:histidinol-phosphatase [Chitinasiproducens palmae]|uniref:Histidinol-phosphatase n=1 Tax=Chitinasiproducens palmae TaxID=1770053 RepID=A0A1H2PLL0_9BURK|nr:histidinol-phosphatase [Chitinasiproducens palmae]SDV47346.1 histidinol-phosphatase, inositol monophosphatase family [Chitinasiproducens palmae]
MSHRTVALVASVSARARITRPRLPADPRELIRFVHAAADAARPVSLGHFRHPLQVDMKPDRSPVTIADRSVEALLRAHIAMRFPAHGILGEEQEAVGKDAEYLWVIDPLDGTRSYVSGWPLWGTLIALLHCGEPVLGLIDMPVLGERWLGIAHEYTMFHGAGEPRTCQTSERCALSDATLYTTSPDAFDARELQAFEAVSERVHARRFGGDCYSYGLLASGHLDIVIEAGLQPYDYLALVPIVEAAGGVITDWLGRRLSVDSGGRVLAAASAALHDAALAILASHA